MDLNDYFHGGYTCTNNKYTVFGRVDLFNRNFKVLPWAFQEVHGWFDCSNNYLESFLGIPEQIHDSLDCSNNKLTSMRGCPKFIKGKIDIYGNKIPPWELRYLLFSEIQGGVYLSSIELDHFFKQYQNKKHLIPEALKELRLLQIKADRKELYDF